MAAMASASLAEPAPKPPGGPTLKIAVAKMRAGDFAGSYALVKPLTEDADLDKWDNAYRHAAWYVLGVDANFLNKPQEALAALKRSSAMPNATGEDWYARLLSAEGARDREDAVLALTTVAETYPDWLGAVTDRAIARTLRAAAVMPQGAERQGRILGALMRADWLPKDPSLDDWSSLWANDAARRLDAGDAQGAAEAARRATWPKAVIAMGADKRFDALRAATPGAFDVQAAYAARIAEAQAAAAAKPRSLQARNALIGALLIDQRYKEALALAQKAAAGGKDAFDDPGAVDWTLELKARALFGLRRGAAGLVALTDAAVKPEDGGPNVSQRLALAGRLLATNQTRGALREAARVASSPDVSVYGRLAAAQIAVCAHAERGERAALAVSLAQLREQAAYGAPLVLKGLVCADDRQGAADLIVQRLGDPATRLDALTLVQTYPLADGATAYDRKQYERLAAILAMPQVAAALDKVGRATVQPRAEIDW
jgi:hypothetical protein